MTFPVKNLLEIPRPLLIAGPCSAESREQLVKTAEALSPLPGVYAFRAGLWKPRTRPGEFEGVGKRGLPWLREVREKTGLKIAVEIAIPSHAEACLKAGIDIVWIGARTIVSPFIIEEIAESLKGSKLTVMVKNPINPDLGLWAGGLERLKKHGIDKLAAIHRGFDAFSSKPYRNIPLWEIPIELMRLFPDLPVLCDPSHISGKRDMIPVLAQKALDFGMHGLMVEVHDDPGKALTDAAQQLNPAEFKKLISNIRIRDERTSPMDSTLERHRTVIDELDGQILELIAKRMQISSLIGEYKKKVNLRPFQADRWSMLIQDRIEKGESLSLDKDFVKRIFDIIHVESLKKQD
jgi:chorismate mutase